MSGNSNNTVVDVFISSCAEKADAYVLRIPFYYTMIFLFVIFICSIVYFIQLKTAKTIYVREGNILALMRKYVGILWKFRSMYGSIFTQLFDQVSDLSVINQLYLLSTHESNYNTFKCYHMNVTHLLYASIFVFVFYRFLSSFLIYRIVKNNSSLPKRLLLAFLQFFDLTFVLTLKINYKFQNVTPCSPQRYITNLEAVYEACPQFIIQSYFLLTLNLTENNYSSPSTSTSSSNNKINYLVLINYNINIF